MKKHWLLFCLISTSTFVFSNTLLATETVKRYAIIVAANDGGIGRVPLRYAETDALSLTKVLKELGGLKNENHLLLLEPSPDEIIKAMAQLKIRISKDKSNVKRSELFFYYSGHSDENGLLLGEERLGYTRLKNALTEVSSDVQIAILDSCASGAFTRIKGGSHKPPFMQDESTSVKGYAIMTSSSASENAQESDAVGGSYFTHYFVSALRGAGDTSLDKKITLNEAYQYAFHETLARTEQSMNGAQHAAYDFKLAGAGDLVLTELTNSAARIKLDEELAGRLYVRDQSGRLVVEINKAAGLYMEVSLPPQRYLITLDKQSTLFETVFTVTKNGNNTLRFDKFQRVDPVISVARGGTSTSSVAEEKMGVSELINYKLAKRKKELANNYQQIPVKLSLFPGISTPAKILNGKKDIAELELQILGSDSDNANISIGYLAATVKEDIIGGQGAGIFSHVGGNLYGGQGAGVVSVTKGNIYGGQGAGVVAISNGDLVGGMGAGILTLTKGDVNGGQGAGIASIISGNLKGGQGAGVASITTGNVIGAQAAGIVNIISGDITGFQVAGILNYTGGNLGGAQVSGLANISSGVNESAQISALNISKHAKELQLGIINIATKNDGLALGLINVIGNGRLDVGVSYDESEYSNLTIRSGAQRIYNHLSIGTKTENEISYTRLRWGIGLNKKYQNSISMDHEILVGSRFQKGDIVKNCTTCSHYSPVITLGSTLSYSIIPEIKLLAGASINILQKHTSDKSSNEQFFGRESDKVWPGALLGVEVSLQ